ncbi:MAG TPA: hypothetical protein DEA52_04080 [Clostridiaceae bacterium]|nr:hypothetical protein [Clostridiaceae bacterium]
MKNLKAVVFDVGNVLIDFNPTKWLLENYEDMGSVKVLYEEVFSGEEWKSLSSLGEFSHHKEEHLCEVSKAIQRTGV